MSLNPEDHVLKENVIKENFNWEIPVETVPLPSRGILYSPDSKLYKKETLQIKAMTAREEDILMSPAYAKDGTTILMLIKSCLIDKTIDVSELTTGDRNALMMSIRITGYGTDYPVTTKCSNCGSSEKINIDLGNLGISRLSIDPVEEGKNEFEYTLPVSKKKITFSFMTYAREKNREAKIEFSKKQKGKNDKSVTTFLEEVIHSVDGITDKNKIYHFIQSMPALDSRKLRSYIAENEPGIVMEHEYRCTNCSHLNKKNIQINSNFFWPE